VITGSDEYPQSLSVLQRPECAAALLNGAMFRPTPEYLRGADAELSAVRATIRVASAVRRALQQGLERQSPGVKELTGKAEVERWRAATGFVRGHKGEPYKDGFRDATEARLERDSMLKRSWWWKANRDWSSLGSKIPWFGEWAEKFDAGARGAYDDIRGEAVKTMVGGNMTHPQRRVLRDLGGDSTARWRLEKADKAGGFVLFTEEAAAMASRDHTRDRAEFMVAGDFGRAVSRPAEGKDYDLGGGRTTRSTRAFLIPGAGAGEWGEETAIVAGIYGRMEFFLKKVLPYTRDEGGELVGQLPLELLRDVLGWLPWGEPKGSARANMGYGAISTKARGAVNVAILQVIWKLHKPVLSSRPVLRAHSTAITHLEKVLASMLTPLLEKEGLVLRDSSDTTQKLRRAATEVRPGAKHEWYTADVTAMYPSISWPFLFRSVWEFSQDHVARGNLTQKGATVMLKLTQFVCEHAFLAVERPRGDRGGGDGAGPNDEEEDAGRELFAQQKGLGMGSACSMQLANAALVMAERRIMRKAGLTVRFYGRYVDDLLMLAEREEGFQEWLRREFAAIDPCLEFTWERGARTIPFLDLKLTWKEAGRGTPARVEYGQYAKAMDLKLYIGAGSHHPPALLAGFIRGEGLRAARRSSYKSASDHTTQLLRASLYRRQYHPAFVGRALGGVVWQKPEEAVAGGQDRWQGGQGKRERERAMQEGGYGRAVLSTEYRPGTAAWHAGLRARGLLDLSVAQRSCPVPMPPGVSTTFLRTSSLGDAFKRGTQGGGGDAR